jgi:hypothetical protein
MQLKNSNSHLPPSTCSPTLGLRCTGPAAAARRATAGWDRTALDELDQLVAALARGRVRGDRGGEGEESEGEGDEAHGGEIELVG